MTGTDPYAPPPFDPVAALATLRRGLRELGLVERAGQFERRGVAIARVTADGDALSAALVRRPVRSSPEWQPRTLRNGAEVRDFLADLRRRLATWADRDD